MIDFAGTGWDVAERMGLVDALRNITYPIDALQYVAENGDPYLSLPITSVRSALAGKYTYLLRTDLERILFERAQSRGLAVRFGTTIQSLRDNVSEVTATLSDGTEQSFAFVFGADGVHSHVRELAFGPKRSSTASWATTSPHFISQIITMASVPRSPSTKSPTARSGYTPWARTRLSAMYVFRHADMGYVPPQQRTSLLKKTYQGFGMDGRKNSRRLSEH